jgi:hypothetical protein
MTKYKPTYVSDDAPGDVQLQLSYPSTADNDRIVDLEAVERMSGMRLFKVRLSAEQFTALLSTMAVNASGAIVAPRPDRIGKRSERCTVPVDRSDDPQAVKVEMLAEGWTTAEVRKTNSGYLVVADRWVEPTRENAAAEGK